MSSISYVIKDSRTGNFCCSNSFISVDKEGAEWLYITCTGFTKERGFICYSTKEAAEKVLDKLNKINEKIGVGLNWYIDECKTIPNGKVVVDNLTI